MYQAWGHCIILHALPYTSSPPIAFVPMACQCLRQRAWCISWAVSSSKWASQLPFMLVQGACAPMRSFLLHTCSLLQTFDHAGAGHHTHVPHSVRVGCKVPPFQLAHGRRHPLSKQQPMPQLFGINITSSHRLWLASAHNNRGLAAGAVAAAEREKGSGGGLLQAYYVAYSCNSARNSWRDILSPPRAQCANRCAPQ